MTNYYRYVNITLSRGEVISPKVGTKVVLLITNPSSFNKKEIKTMIWLIFAIWMSFIIVCTIMEKITGSQFYMFLFFVSLPIIFYIPLVFGLY